MTKILYQWKPATWNWWTWLQDLTTNAKRRMWANESFVTRPSTTRMTDVQRQNATVTLEGITITIVSCARALICMFFMIYFLLNRIVARLNFHHAGLCSPFWERGVNLFYKHQPVIKLSCGVLTRIWSKKMSCSQLENRQCLYSTY